VDHILEHVTRTHVAGTVHETCPSGRDVEVQHIRGDARRITAQAAEEAVAPEAAAETGSVAEAVVRGATGPPGGSSSIDHSTDVRRSKESP
jgi:hypothetical protein